MGRNSGEIVNLEEAQNLRDHFLGWQCRVRKQSMRDSGGRPSLGMAPLVSVGDEELGRIIVLIVKRRPEATTTQFNYIIRQTQDPTERYDKGLKLLQAEYYEDHQGFSDRMTALFGPNSSLVERLLEARRCTLDFEQTNQKYQIPCRVERLTPDDPAYQATYWHNHLFNPEMPPSVQVLAFTPDWRRTTASPSPWE
jgi:hypothetical protein